MKQALKIKLLNYLRQNGGWHKKVSLYLVADNLGYSPETAGRELRELEEEGSIKVDYYKGKYARRLARYTADEIPVENKVEVVLVDGIWKAVMI